MGGSETREKAARTKEVLASIGQGLREQYDPTQPFSERLATLVRRIEQSTNTRRVGGRATSSVDYRRYAAELVAIADHVGDHQSRAVLLAMAQSWQHLAAQIEKNLQTVLVYET
jgi:uncharacterized protein (DUF2336 family)